MRLPRHPDPASSAFPIAPLRTCIVAASVVALLLFVLAAPSADGSLAFAQADWDGSGIVVAVVGSGVDYTHADLGGSGDAADYEANDPTVLEPGSFPTDVVVGGYDFAGEIYSDACEEPPQPDTDCLRQPAPDPDPLDAPGGQGTRIAALVRRAAPGATIVALKIGGSPEGVASVSRLQAEAARWVLAQNAGLAVPGMPPVSGTRIDVVVFESGTLFGLGRGDLDPLIEALGAQGVTVVAAAQEAGQTPYAAGDPGGASAALGVAALQSGDRTTWGVRASWEDSEGAKARDIEAIESDPPLPQLADVGPIEAPLAWYGEACTDDEGNAPPPAQDLNERIALVARGTCTFAEKLRNAEAYGAIAVLMYTDQRPKRSVTCGNPCDPLPAIPSAMIDNAEGQSLQALVETPIEVIVRMDADYTFRMAWLENTLLGGTGRGPDRLGGGFSPRLAFLGEADEVARAGTGDGRGGDAGTAVSAAGVAGLAARAQQRRVAEGLALEGLDVAAMLMSHAAPEVHVGRNDTGPLAAAARQGAGSLDEAAALGADTLVRSEDGIAELDFGLVWGAGARGRQTRSLRVRNLGAAARSFRASFAYAFPQEDAEQGVEVAIPEPELRVAPGAEASVDVHLDWEAEALRAWTLARGNAVSDPDELQALEIDGWLRLDETDETGALLDGGEVHALPLRALPRPASCAALTEGDGFHLASPGDGVEARWANDCPTDTGMTWSWLAGEDPAESAAAIGMPPGLDIVAVGMRYGPADPDDPDDPEEPDETPVLEWRVATAGGRRIPAGAMLDVLVDLDRDGEIDRIVTAQHGPEVRGGYDVGDWIAMVTYPQPGTLEPETSGPHPEIWPVAYDLDDEGMTLRISAEAMLWDFESEGETFRFFVRLRDGLGDGITDPGAGYAGEDYAPDGALEGEAYHFEQALAECLTVGDAALPVPRLGADRLPGESSSASRWIRLAEGCPLPAEGADAGILLSYGANPPGVADGRDRVLRGRIGGAPPTATPPPPGPEGQIYLPAAER